MKTTLTYAAKQLKLSLCLTFILGISLSSFAQGITVYQYRQVPQDKIDEFIKRETTYWSKVAEKGFEKGNLQFWALLQKVGGYDIQNSSNFLFINTYLDLDNLGGTWNPSSVFPDVPIADMETNSMSKTTSQLFLRDRGWQQVENANPETDFKFLKMIYHQSSNPGRFVQAEVEHWGPFIKSAMDSNKTSQKAWGNATVLSPTGFDMQFNTVSYDIYPSMNQVLIPDWADDLVVPEGMSSIMELENGPRSSVVYRIVKAISADNP